MDKTESLRALLPSFEVPDGVNLKTEEEIFEVLENYFHLENWVVTANNAIHQEVACILQLFPSLDVEYVRSELQKYRTYRNRVEIVLINIIEARRNSSKLTNKRPNLILNDENEPPKKAMKTATWTVTSGELDQLEAGEIRNEDGEVRAEEEGAQAVLQDPLVTTREAQAELQTVEAPLQVHEEAEKLREIMVGALAVQRAPEYQRIVEEGWAFERPDVEAPREQYDNVPLDLELPTPLEGATAVTPHLESAQVDQQLVNNLCSIFPEACPKYIRQTATGKKQKDLDVLVTLILDTNDNYPKRPKLAPEPEELPPNQIEILEELLPDADPDYLRMICDQCEGRPDVLKTFLNNALEKQSYPTKKDYLRRQQQSVQQKQYTTNFTVEKFVQVIANPAAFFADPKRSLKLSPEDEHYVLVSLRNKYNKLPVRTIQQAFTRSACNIGKTIRALEKLSKKEESALKTKRKVIDVPTNIENIPLLQELAYYTHQKEIATYLKTALEQEKAERQQMKNDGLLRTCSCCYDDQVMPKDIFTCDGDCEFCKSCVVKSVEVLYGEQKLDFPCLMNCSRSFSIPTLKAVLPPKLFSKIAQKKAVEEVKSAGIEDLEYCPFCDFATIPAEGNKIFTCMNEECMKESCRMCKEPSHIPLKCDEIERDADVKARVFVEDKMTEALLRKCHKCGIKFFKEDGCNKMTCTCGAQMCYVCGQPVENYKHFNGNGGDRFDLCPLYSDTHELNKSNILRGAQAAKVEIGNAELKHDPTLDVNAYYTRRARAVPQVHLLVGQELPPVLQRPPFPLAVRRLEQQAQHQRD